MAAPGSAIGMLSAGLPVAAASFSGTAVNSPGFYRLSYPDFAFAMEILLEYLGIHVNTFP